MANNDAAGIHEATNSELADFEKAVDLLIGEYHKFELARHLLLSVSGMTASVCLYLGYVALSEFLADESLTFPLTLSAFTLVAIVLSIFALKRSLQSIARRRRTCEELAELVREIAPAFMPRMSLVRRAEIKIRLSNIGIYDPLKYP